jgi:hypothetical protein
MGTPWEHHVNITACVFGLGDTTYCCGAFTQSATTSCFLGLGHGGGSSHYRERPPVSGVLDTIWAHSHGRRQPPVSWELDTCCGTFTQSEMIACMSWDLDAVLWCVRTVRDYNLHVLGLGHCCGAFTRSERTAYVSWDADTVVACSHGQRFTDFTAASMKTKV